MASLINRQRNSGDHPESATVGVDQAWKMFDVISLLVRASEVKSSAALAANGIAAGVLYNVIKGGPNLRPATAVLASLCLTSIILSGFCVAIALIPRLRVKGTPANLIYFNDVARRYSRCDDYLAVFRKTVTNERELVDQIGAQTWANANIARRKFLWTTWAIILLFVAFLLLGITIFSAEL